MKPLTVVDDDTLPLKKQSTITLRAALGFGAQAALSSEWQAFSRQYDGQPSDLHAAYLLLTYYILDWSGPVFKGVPYSIHALSQQDPYMPILIKARQMVRDHHMREPAPIVQPDGPPPADPEYESMVGRWREKLRARDSRTIVAGRHDTLVSLIWTLKMTQRQINEEFEPAVLGELLARLDAEARNQDDTSKGKKKGPRPVKPMTRAEKIAQMQQWGKQPTAPEVA
jgi:hypothetical protein